MKKLLFGITCVTLLVLAGCGHAEKYAQHMDFGQVDIKAQIERDDFVVMKSVEGSSTLTNYFWVVQVIDGDKLQILGIPFFKDKYTGWKSDKTLNRAYYKALENAPDADAVFQKSYDFEVEGIPFILGTRTATVRGKAMTLKSDN